MTVIIQANPHHNPHHNPLTPQHQHHHQHQPQHTNTPTGHPPATLPNTTLTHTTQLPQGRCRPTDTKLHQSHGAEQRIIETVTQHGITIQQRHTEELQMTIIDTTQTHPPTQQPSPPQPQNQPPLSNTTVPSTTGSLLQEYEVVNLPNNTEVVNLPNHTEVQVPSAGDTEAAGDARDARDARDTGSHEVPRGDNTQGEDGNTETY